jgi:hypothetical protein
MEINYLTFIYMYNYDNVIWIILLFVLFIILGLYLSEYTPLDLNERKKAIELSYIRENFSSSPSSSSTNDQSEGASQLYNWGLPEDKIVVNNTPTAPSTPAAECPHDPPHIYGCSPTPAPTTTCIQAPQKSDCSKCDITSNRDIDKYILKSSIPPCPDMSEFITKNMINANPDLSDYILKSEIKPCEKVDVSQYILKSQIPACPTCPICPECPICPVCPPQQPQEKCKQIFEYNIREHPDIANYLSMEDVSKNFIPKDQILNSDIVKNYLKENCKTSQSVQPPPQEETKYKKFIDKVYENPIPPKDVMGYYAGDSLFAGV